jgi:hypothetical protein
VQGKGKGSKKGNQEINERSRFNKWTRNSEEENNDYKATKYGFWNLIMSK